MFLENKATKAEQWFEVDFTEYARPCHYIKCYGQGHNKLFSKSLDFNF